jgi:hypothetical protein
VRTRELAGNDSGICRPVCELGTPKRLGPAALRPYVRFDTMLKLVENRTELQIIFEILERGLDLDELDIELPQLGRVLVA